MPLKYSVEKRKNLMTPNSLFPNGGIKDAATYLFIYQLTG
jgi:hypothetical protein